MDLVILAGGKGSRIKHLNKNRPKPMVRIQNKAFLEILINHYAKFTFENIFILAGYKGQLIKKKFDGKYQNFTKIECIIEKSPRDTGGALLLLKNKIKKDFILINGDTYFDINNPLELVENVKKTDIGCISLIKYKNVKSIKFNNLKLDKYHNIIKVKKSNYINAGVYYFNKKIFNFIDKKKISLESEILPTLIGLKKLKGKYFKDYFLDIGTPKNLKFAKKNLPKKLERPAFFFDRDGVINHDVGYTHKYKEFRFRKNVIKALQYLCDKKYYLFIVTNQGGIAKKKYTVEDFYSLHLLIKKKLAKNNVYIHDVEFCPHHPDGLVKKLSIKCKCRKPSNLMIENIKKKWFINMEKSYFIGDKKSDESASKKSKLKFNYVQEDLLKQVKKYHYIFPV